MVLLTKGVYGTEFKPAKNAPFGLYCGQVDIWARIFYHSNYGWYNKFGEKLGFGDLAPDDFFRIAKEINDDEFFIILGEYDSYWYFVTEPHFHGKSQVRPEETNPGIEYVLAYCRYIIAKNRIFSVGFNQSLLYENGIEIREIRREAAKSLVQGR